MISAHAFIDAARRAGFDFYAGVPCSYLTPLINAVSSDRGLRYVGAASEGEAVAIAAGAWLAGRRTVVMCQNSGLGNAVNPLTSLNAPFRIPTLLVTTWRGRPGEPDEPQHEVMGRISHSLLNLIGVPQLAFPDTGEAIVPTLDTASERMEHSGLPFALVMAKGAVADSALDEPAWPPRPAGQRLDLATGGPRPARAEALACFLAVTGAETAVIATTGKTGRELFTLADRPQHLYQVGSMGCASPMGLGIALTTSAKTLVLDGKLDADDISVVFSEKQQIIRKSGTLEYYESQEKFTSVAGLENLKDWLSKRSAAFSDRAALFGLPAPKGVLLLGVQGCGKSLCAKAASSLWKLPLLRFDIGRVFGSLVEIGRASCRERVCAIV